MLLGLAACGPSAPAAAPEPPATVYVLAAPAPPATASVSNEPAPPARPRSRRDWHVFRSGQELPKELGGFSREASRKGLLPVVYMTSWSCEPCRSLKDSLSDPRMQEAFEGTSILEVNMHQIPAGVLSDLGLQPHGIPAFYVLDEQGHVTGAMITGAAWGDDIPENMAPPLTEFFSRQPR